MQHSNFAFLRFLDQESDAEEPPSPPTRLSVLEPPTRQVGPGNILRLPDGIIHEILWGLGIEGIARFRCLSKACKRLSESVRRLRINSQEIGDDPTLRKRFHEFLTGYFRERLYLKSFEVSWVFKEGNSRNELEYIVYWLQEAISCCVKYIRINFQPRKELHALTQQVHESIPIDSLNRRISTRFGCIKVLSLNSVALEESSISFGRLIGDWMRLRRLKLVNIRGIKNLKFISNSLEELFLDNFEDGSLRQIYIPEAKKLKKLIVSLNSYDDNDSFLFLYAAQLSTLSLNGDIRVNGLEDLSKLESASLYWKEDPYRRSQNKQLLDTKVAAVLRSASRARFLVTDELFLQSLLEREELAIPTFDHAEDVIVYVSPSDDFQLDPIAIFLIHFPNVRCLFLRSHRRTGEVNDNRGGRGRVDWKDRRVVQVIQQLEVIKIQLFNRRRTEEIIKYFLRRSRALKKLTITFLT